MFPLLSCDSGVSDASTGFLVGVSSGYVSRSSSQAAAVLIDGSSKVAAALQVDVVWLSFDEGTWSGPAVLDRAGSGSVLIHLQLNLFYLHLLVRSCAELKMFDSSRSFLFLHRK